MKNSLRFPAKAGSRQGREKIKSSKFPLVVFIIGPTAVGKSEIAVKLAKRIKGEIISCDSMQIYKDMDVITQRPPSELTKQIPHYLIGMIRPDKNSSAADFRTRALAKIKYIVKRRKVPIIVGGSGLYVKALIDGLFPSPPADEKLRNRLLAKEMKSGQGSLYEMLQDKDPQAALKIHPNDLRRIIRALEVYEKTKTPMSELKKQTEGLDRHYNIEIFGLTMPRGQIYKRTDERVDEMFKEGIVDEVKKLGKYNLSKTAFYALGVKEIKGFFNGEYSLERAKDLLKQNTRRFVKKQITWFKPDKRITWINIGPKTDGLKITDKMIRILKKERCKNAP